ncbi:hypothetical protein SBOR_6428 [Sclerotinia borealis F-4128]|uniref:Phytanoyl-CoA dioxygenase family protein n=1 Tax=Sclerotinia borealis (strain F-4128) TaxID=1432307 RepID=W9CBH0_SCLBF|nr:hypothetical protein SBOR_6428 [Sclerotinia borealis F-4128]
MAPSATTNEQAILPIRKSGPKYNADKSEAQHNRALSIIKEKLPLMSVLKGLIVININPSKPDIIIDARGEISKLLDGTDEKEDCRVNTKSIYIIEFYEGRLEPRYGLFKDAFFHKAYLPQGDIKMAIKFADMLTPNPPSPLKKFTGNERLPQPTEDLEQVKADMREFGYGLVKNALTPEEITKYQRAVKLQAAGETKAGVAANDGGPNTPNQRIWTLTNKGQEFVDMLEHPLIDEIVPEFLGEQALLHTYTANIARPGNVPMQLHTDQVAIQPPLRNINFGVNIMWFLADVTEKNGGTRVFPGSHLGAVAPEDVFDLEGSVAAQGPAGTALCFESRLWHATGPNRETEGERPVVFMFFMRSFVRQQENNFLSLRPEVEAGLNERVKAFLGFRTTGALGGLEGEVREGIFVKKLENAVGPFRDEE